MTIQEYLAKLDLFQKKENGNAFFKNAELEKFVLKISSDSTENYFMLDSFLQKSVSGRIEINSQIIKQFSNQCGLLYIEEEETGNVCYADSNEVRSEFRQSFRLIDFLDYIHAFTHSSIFKESQKIIMPPNVDYFWKLVKIGNNIRKAEK